MSTFLMWGLVIRHFVDGGDVKIDGDIYADNLLLPGGNITVDNLTVSGFSTFVDPVNIDGDVDWMLIFILLELVHLLVMSVHW